MMYNPMIMVRLAEGVAIAFLLMYLVNMAVQRFRAAKERRNQLTGSVGMHEVSSWLRPWLADQGRKSLTARRMVAIGPVRETDTTGRPTLSLPPKKPLGDKVRLKHG